MRVGFGRGVAIAATALLTSGCFVQAGFAGEGNVLYLVQDTSPGSTSGQSFQSDQHLSINSSIGTLLRPVTQSGDDNSASITIDSACTIVTQDCGHASLTQNNDYQDALAGSGLKPWQQDIVGAALGRLNSQFGGNSAVVSVTGGGTASVAQYGFGNDASVSATDASASINQIGLGNTASLSVTPLGSGAPASFALNQIGLNNTAGLVVLATAGTSSSYTQVGANGTHGSPTDPVSITTTSSVNVTHYSF